MKTYTAEFNSDSFNQSGVEPRIRVNCSMPLNSIESGFVSISSIDLLGPVCNLFNVST